MIKNAHLQLINDFKRTHHNVSINFERHESRLKKTLTRRFDLW